MRLIRPNEINAYVKTVKNNKGLILLYKDSRYDMAVLDEEFGTFGWETSYQEIKGTLYCTIRVWDAQRSHWVEKTSNGVESDMEAQKGEASDALKRAGFLLGIGRELYTAPVIFVSLNQDEVDNYNGKERLKLGVTFNVSEIEYDDSRNISKLVIVDRFGKQRFKWENGKPSKATAPLKKAENKDDKEVTSEPPLQPQSLQASVKPLDKDEDFENGFKPIANFTPIEAWKHLISKVGLEEAKNIVEAFGLKTQDDIKNMSEFTYQCALRQAEKRFYDSVIAKETT